MSDEEHSNSAFYYPEEQWRSQGGARGATAPPMVPKTVLVKSLNPGRNFRGGVDVLNNELNLIIKLQKNINSHVSYNSRGLRYMTVNDIAYQKFKMCWSAAKRSQLSMF